MKTVYEPLFTQVGVVPGSARCAAGRHLVERDEFQTLAAQAEETLADTRFPVPLYVIAAAALLG